MKRFILDTFVSSLISTLIAVGTTHAGAVAVSSSIHLSAQVNAGRGDVTNFSSQSQLGTTDSLSASVGAYDSFATGSVTATANANATFFGADAGQVILSNIGWTSVNVSNGNAVLDGEGNDFNYTFTADKDEFFRLDYSFSAVGQNTFGLNGFWIDFDGNQIYHQTFLSLLHPQGTIIEPLSAGKTYFFRIDNAANIYGGLGNLDAHMTGLFNFQINDNPSQPVPEPSTFVLLGLGGIGLVVNAYRRWTAAI